MRLLGDGFSLGIATCLSLTYIKAAGGAGAYLADTEVDVTAVAGGIQLFMNTGNVMNYPTFWAIMPQSTTTPAVSTC